MKISAVIMATAISTFSFAANVPVIDKYDITSNSDYCHDRGQPCSELEKLVKSSRRTIQETKLTKREDCGPLCDAAESSLQTILDALNSISDNDDVSVDEVTEVATDESATLTKRSPSKMKKFKEKVGKAFSDLWWAFEKNGVKNSDCYNRGQSCVVIKRDETAVAAAEATKADNDDDAEFEEFAAAASSCWQRQGPCEAIQRLAGELLDASLPYDQSEQSQVCHADGEPCSNAKRSLDHLKVVAREAIDSLAA